jgi:hypothetical protein
MRATLIVFGILVMPGMALGQANEPRRDVDCAAELEWVVDYAAANYAGFETKTAGDARARYDALVAELRPAAAAAGSAVACNEVLRRWTAFFGDGHLSFSRRAASAPNGDALPADASDDAIRAHFADSPRRDVTEAEARSRLEALGSERAPIEGIWEMAAGNYRGAVLRDDAAGTRFSMSILRADSVWWTPGQIKAVFRPHDDGYAVQFFMRDHSEQAWTGRVMRNVLSFDQGSEWFREWPVAAGDVSREQFAATRNDRFAARDVAPGTVLVQVPSFDDPVRMDSLFAAEQARISGAERLIIDLRGNGGGSDYNFRMLLPLIYTDTIRMISNAALATEDNIRVNELLAADTTLPAAVRTSLASNVERMRTVIGGWYEFDDRVLTDYEVLERPRRVDVLVDRGCASSCEQFLLAARQSAKVTIYGSRTAGILDFGNVRTAVMPGGSLVLNYPTTRSKRLPHAPVDGVGIQPLVPVPADEVDPVNWVLRHAQ